jgi:hypothetical protein
MFAGGRPDVARVGQCLPRSHTHRPTSELRGLRCGGRGRVGAGGVVTHEEIAAWEGFAVALAGAAAVLSGLLFVAVSLNMERILRIRTLPGRAGESVILFLGALVECAYLLIPSQSDTALAIELIITGALIAGVLLAIVVPATRITTRIPRSWHITRFAVVLGATVPVVLAGFAVLGALPGGLTGSHSQCCSRYAQPPATRGCCWSRWSATNATAQSTNDRSSHRLSGPRPFRRVGDRQRVWRSRRGVPVGAGRRRRRRC